MTDQNPTQDPNLGFLVGVRKQPASQPNVTKPDKEGFGDKEPDDAYDAEDNQQQ